MQGSARKDVVFGAAGVYPVTVPGPKWKSWLDIVPKGRDEGNLVYGMEWVRHHDKYGDRSFVDPYVELLPARKAGNES